MTSVKLEGAEITRAELLEHGITHDQRSVQDPIQASRARAAFQGSMKGRIDMSRFDEDDEEIAREFGMLG